MELRVVPDDDSEALLDVWMVPNRQRRSKAGFVLLWWFAIVEAIGMGLRFFHEWYHCVRYTEES